MAIMPAVDTTEAMIDWNIQSRAHVCQQCGKRFEDKQPYHTLLFDEKQEFRRSDVCQACWQEQHQEGGRDRKGFVSYWQGVYEAPPPAPPDPMQKETVESLLRKIIELNDPQYTATSYILAVMLERKRILKVKEQLRRDGQRVFVYEHPKSGDLFTIPDPDLQLDQLEQVQHDVALLLEHGLNPAPPIEAVASEIPEPQPGMDPVQGGAADSANAGEGVAAGVAAGQPEPGSAVPDSPRAES